MKVLKARREVIRGGRTVYVAECEGTSKEQKPTEYWNGTTYAETDTGKQYVFDNGAWLQDVETAVAVPAAEVPEKKPVAKKQEKPTTKKAVKK